jgi:hypothetical protein
MRCGDERMPDVKCVLQRRLTSKVPAETAKQTEATCGESYNMERRQWLIFQIFMLGAVYMAWVLRRVCN